MALPDYKLRLKAWRTLGFLKSQKALTVEQRRKLEKLSTLELAAAARNGDHSLIGREAAQTLLRQRSGRMIEADIQVPGFVTLESKSELKKRFYGKVRTIRVWTGWLTLTTFVVAIITAGFASEMEGAVFSDGVKAGLFSQADVLDSNRNLTEEEISQAPEEVLETWVHETKLRHVLLYQGRETPAGKRMRAVENLGYVLVSFMIITFLIWFVLTVFRRQPARVLLLRKFNDAAVSKSLGYVISDRLRVYGHIVTLSDKYVRRSRFAMIWNALPSNFAHLFLIIVWFPIRMVLRQFNRAKYGPVWVGSARNYRALARRLRDKWALNLEVAWTRKEAFIIRTHDKWWQEVVALIMGSSDFIVTDLSNVTSGTQWELDRLNETGLHTRSLFIVREERFQAARVAISQFDWNSKTRIYVYNSLGKFVGADEKDFPEAALEKLHQSVIGATSGSGKSRKSVLD